ncbi:MAG TPA: ABC transporter permease [Bacilli bacterium]
MKIRALAIRIIRQFVHDKRSLALMFVAPIVIMTLLSLIFNGAEYKPKIAVVNAPAPLIKQLEDYGATVHQYDVEKAEKELEANHLDAILSLEGRTPHVKLEGSDPTVNKSVLLMFQKLVQKTAAQPFSADITYLHGSEDMAAFDNFGPVLVGYFAFFFVFLLAGVAFLRERTGGTLERLMATPLKRWEIVAGYVIGFGVFAILQSLLITWFTIKVLGMLMVGSFWYVLLIILLTALSALTLGTFLSAFANNEFQMIQFIPLVIVPQAFFSGLFNMDTMAQWLRWIGNILPFTYSAQALRDVMIRGKGWDAIAPDLYILLGFSLVFAVANVLALKKYRPL